MHARVGRFTDVTPETPGTRASVDLCEVKVERTAS